MEQLAARTGGRFFRARDAGAVTAIYKEVDAIERAPTEDPTYLVRERFAGFVAAAVVLLLAARALRTFWIDVTP